VGGAYRTNEGEDIRFEVFRAVTMNNCVLWDVTPSHGVTSHKTQFFQVDDQRV
jgi:hypothetical protein